MKPSTLYGVAMGLVVAAALVIIVTFIDAWIGREANSCRSAGGAFVKTDRGWECLIIRTK